MSLAPAVPGSFVSPAAAQTGGSVFVTNLNSDDVSQYAIGAGGELSSLSPPAVAAGTRPFGIAVSPDGASAYVGNADNTISQYDVDQQTGALSPKTPATVVTVSQVGAIAVSPDGKSAYVTNLYPNYVISQYDIDPQTGTLSPKTPPTVFTDQGPFDIAVNPDGHSVYVTNSFPSKEVSQYDVDPQTGALSPKTPASVTTRYCLRICRDSTPTNIALTPEGRSAYVADMSRNAVVQFNIDPDTGALSPKFPTPVQTGDPPLYAPAGLGAYDVVVTPDGKSAYVANRDDNTISQFDIDQQTGALSAKTPATVAAGTAPHALAASTDGGSAYVINRDDNTISQYGVDPSSGALSPQTPATVATGTTPYGIAVSPPPLPIRHGTTTALSCSPGAVVDAPSTTCTATVADTNASGQSTPSGMVSFSSDSSGTFGSGGSCTLSGSGASASCQVTYTPSAVGSGTHTLTASYNGEATHGNSARSTSVNVTKRLTSPVMSCSPQSVSVGHGTYCTVTVTDTDAGSPSTPSGTVSFSSDFDGRFNGFVAGSCTLTVGVTSASCQVNYIPAEVGSGTHTLTAAYQGDDKHAVTSGTTSIAVGATATDVGCARSTVAVGQSTTCTATVTNASSDGNENTPSGIVNFSSDSSGSFGSGGSCTLSGIGASVSCQVTYTPSALGSGTHRLTASYQGDGSHATSTGSTNVLVINPPEVTSVSPGDGATGVARTTAVVAVFSAAMDKPATQGAFSLTRTSDVAVVNGTFSWYGNALIFVPASPLANGTNYTATVSTAAKDLFGNTLGAAQTWRFTTATQPLITSVTPAVDATGVYPNAAVVAIFDTAMDKPSAQSAFSLKRTSNGAVVNGTFAWYGNALIFKPSADLAPGVQYTAMVSTAAKDLASHALPAAKTWKFTTTTYPIIELVTPSSGATAVSRSAVVRVTFSKAMNKTSAQSAFSLKRTSSGAVVNGSFSWTGNVLTFTPSSALASSTQYTANETAAAKDSAGNALLNPQSWRFTTGS